jgi:hypothetical protein
MRLGHSRDACGSRRSGYRGEVLDVAGDADGPQAGMALKRIREDQSVTAIYGFSGGGYNARAVWSQLNEDQRRRIKKIVVVGSPGVAKANFQGVSDVIIKTDPPAGHMAGQRNYWSLAAHECAPADYLYAAFLIMESQRERVA